MLEPNKLTLLDYWFFRKIDALSFTILLHYVMSLSVLYLSSFLEDEKQYEFAKRTTKYLIGTCFFKNKLFYFICKSSIFLF